MTTINTMTAKEAYETALNDPIARIINKSSLEEIIKTDANSAYFYARDVIKGRWEDGEEIIKTDANSAYEYARDVIKGRWQDGEEIIKTSKSQYHACMYADEVIKGRWIEGEEIIKTTPQHAHWYAKHVIKGEWPEGEKIIATDPKLAFDYCYRVTEGRCKTIEKYILEKRLNLVLYELGEKTILGYKRHFYNYAESDRGQSDTLFSRFGVAPPKRIQEAIKCYYYAIDNIKGRWIEAEDIIKQFDTAWSMYQEFLETLPLTDDEWAEKVQNECKNMLKSA